MRKVNVYDGDEIIGTNCLSNVKTDILRLLFQQLEEHCSTYNEEKYYQDEYFRGYYEGYGYAIIRSMLDIEKNIKEGV